MVPGVRGFPLINVTKILNTARVCSHKLPGTPFTKRSDDVSPQDLAKSGSRVVQMFTFPITLQFDRHLGSSAAYLPVNFQSDTIFITYNLAD